MLCYLVRMTLTGLTSINCVAVTSVDRFGYTAPNRNGFERNAEYERETTRKPHTEKNRVKSRQEYVVQLYTIDVRLWSWLEATKFRPCL